MVNRVWLHLFGRGLVPTPDNFGAAGLPPANPALLDHLAVAFVDDGWSREEADPPDRAEPGLPAVVGPTTQRAYEADPDNALVWRMTPRRLEAEALRDAMLAAAGRLERTPPAGSAGHKAGEGHVPAYRLPRRSTPTSDRAPGGLPAGGPRQLPESLALFDFPDPSLVAGERATTTVPAQGPAPVEQPVRHQARRGAPARSSRARPTATCRPASSWRTRRCSAGPRRTRSPGGRRFPQEVCRNVRQVQEAGVGVVLSRADGLGRVREPPLVRSGRYGSARGVSPWLGHRGPRDVKVAPSQPRRDPHARRYRGPVRV